MGGVGSGNWYRFDKRTTTNECHSIDVRHLHRKCLLTPGHWFTLRWSRADRETGSIRGAVTGSEKPEQVILTYRHRSGSGGEWEDVREPVPLSWTACNFGGERPWFICPGAGCGRRVAAPDLPGRRFCRPGVAGRLVASWLHGHGRCARGRGRRARTPPRRTEHEDLEPEDQLLIPFGRQRSAENESNELPS
jgi:hypothetical protein